MSVESLKKDARRHEQREEWIKALDLYLQAIEAQAGEDEPDIALHNRVGDLQVRLGDLEGAVSNYERAITLYLSAELPNNAIAVCRKITRHDPERPAPFLRMGQIRAQQGFMVDARQNFLTYAEMMQSRGETDEAFRALEEFASLAPNDVETRLFLADQFVAREQIRDALYFLSEAYCVLDEEGEADRANEILGKIRMIDPNHAVPTRSESQREEVLEVQSSDDSEELGIPSFEPEPSPTGIVDSTEPTVLDAEEGIDSADDVEPSVLVSPEAPTDQDAVLDAASDGLTLDSGALDLEDLEITHFGELAGDIPEEDVGTGLVEGLEATGLGELAADVDDAVTETNLVPDESALAEDVEVGREEMEVEDDDAEVAEGEDALADLPLIHFDLDEAELDGGPSEEESELVEVDAADGRASSGLEEGQDDEELSPIVADTMDSEVSLRSRVESNPDDAEGWHLLGAELFSQERADEAWGAMERAHETYAENGEPEKAIDVVRALLEREPGRIELRQRVVEYAHRTNEHPLLIEAFLDLASGLGAQGESQKARAVLEQVLDLDPDNERAKEVLATELSVASAGVAEVSEIATEKLPGEEPATDSRDEFVDLGALVLEGDHEETTRWTVEAEEPTGDEDEDFARMLSQFKEQVAANLSGEDARSHYDLGAAYKEMGLLHEAIAEFQQAIRADSENLAAFELLGACFLEKGEPEVAIRTLERGLNLPTPVEDDLLGVYYWLGQAHEAVGNDAGAREFYEKIFSLDINFKDVTERLKTLR